MGPHARARIIRPRTVAALLTAATAFTAGCTYQYDDGLAPLGQREASASAAASSARASASAEDRARRSQAQRGSATKAPLDQLIAGPALQEWANRVLPDDSGLSLSFSASAVWPSDEAPTMGIDAQPGPATLRFACRGIGLAAVRVSAGDTELLNTTFTCNRPWARPVDVPASGHLEVQFSSAGDTASNIAYRLARP